MEKLDIDPLLSYLACFVIALVIFHVLFVWPRNLSLKKWKFIDYAWLGIGLLCLISLSGQIRTEKAGFEEKLAKSRVQGMHELFSSFYINEPQIYFCREFVTSTMSPVNFDETQKEFDRACEWFKNFTTEFSRATIPNYRQVSWEQFNPPQFNDKSLKDILDGMKKQLGFYASAVRDLELTREARNPTSLESNFHVLWPYLLGIATALRMAKTTGEILHGRK